MENQTLFVDPYKDPHSRNGSTSSLIASRSQYAQATYSGAFGEPGPGPADEYLQIYRRRKGTLILMVLLGLLASLLLTLPQKRIYEARGSVEIQSLNENFLNIRNVSPTADVGDSDAPGSELQTQAKILQSEALLERVATKLDLGRRLFPEEGSGHLSAWRKALGLQGGRQTATREKMLTLIAENLKISSEANTRLIEIRYDSFDPQLAADFVNTLTAEFIQQNVESRWKTAQQTGDFLTRQMEDLRTKLEKSEDQLQSFAQASGLLFVDEKDNVSEERLRQLQEELSKAQADRVASQSKYELVSTVSPDSLPEVLDDKTLMEYQLKLTDLRRELAELSSSLTAANPAVKKIQAQVTALESAINKERTNIIERIGNEFESSQRREKLLAANYVSQSRLMSEQTAQVTHYNILKREVDTNSQLYDSMLQNVQEAGMASALGASNIRVVDTAKPPMHPYKPNVIVNSALGLLGGFCFGIALVVVQERADRTIHSPGEATIYLDVPELGAIPAAKAARNRFSAYYQNGKGLETKKLTSSKPSRVELVTSNKEPSLLADAFRATLTSILFSGVNGNRPRIIAITSPNTGEGKTTVACNLALALAELSPSVHMQSILLIDADLRRPRLHEIFGVPNQWGLADILDGKEPPDGCEGMVFKTAFKNLNLLPSGLSTTDVSVLLHSPRAFAFLNRMREEFHTVIIDGPPMLNMPDARVLGRLSDGVILVVRSAGTMRDDAVAAKQRLADDGTRVLGTILNQWDPRETIEHSYEYTKRYYR